MSDTYTWLDKTFNFLSSNKDLITYMFGFLFTISGAIVGWLLNSWTVKTQLKHDAEEKEKDRQHQIIKEVYLDAFESISKMVFNLQLLSPDDVEIATEKEKERINIKDIDLKHNKIELVGSENTLKAFSKFIECYFETRTKLEEKLSPFFGFKIKFAEAEEQKETSIKIRDDIHNERMALFKEPDYNKDFEKHLAKKYEEESDKIILKNTECIEISKRLAVKGLEYDNYKKITLADLYFVISELAIEIRKDLKMILDESEYRVQINEHHKRMNKIFDDYTKMGKSAINHLMESVVKKE